MQEENLKCSSLTFKERVKIFCSFSQSQIQSKAVLAPDRLGFLYSKVRTLKWKCFRGGTELYTKP